MTAPAPAPAPAPALRVEGSLAFGGRPLFAGLALAAPAGAWTCLLGPSGVGKSTVLRLLAGLPVEGRFEGVAGDAAGAPLAGRVAWMGQADLLLPWLDVTENVLIGARLRGEAPDRARAARRIAEVGLTEHAAKTPRALSGGMRQRAALARLLMEDRPVALLDEPFAALDLALRLEMQDLAARVLAGRTVLLVTHDAHEAARMGERVLLMGPEGCREVPAAPGRPPRPADAPEVLAAQAALTRALVARAA